jgi:hypothetical protein
MGALSPRTRNAQVELYQNGDVDFLVATDAIGMGLNMDIDHVAFAATDKFDGTMRRPLRANELAQIAGRAGRHMNDGTFGVTADGEPLDSDTVEAVENHRFDPVRVIQWRNTSLDYASLTALDQSLDALPPTRGLSRARAQDDQLVLRILGAEGLNTAHRVKNRRVIAAPKTAPNVRQGACGQLLGQPHRRLPGAGDGAIAALRNQVDLLEAEMLRGGLLDIINGDALFPAAQMRTKDGLGLIKGQARHALTNASHQGVKRALQFPNAFGKAIGEKLQNLWAGTGPDQTLLTTQEVQFLFQDAKAKGTIGGLNATNQTGLKV